MTVDIRIEFENNPSGIFYAGQLLSGTVWLTLGEEKKVRGVYIRIYGKAHCEWSTGSGKYRNNYVGEENYLNETTYLVGSKEGNITLEPGTQSYNFQCNLPNGLPTSVEAGTGYIRYVAHVTMDIPKGFDKELKRRFTVIRPMNLNGNPKLKQLVIVPISEIDCCSSFWCCFCIRTNPIEVSALVPVSGYAPGQTVNLLLQVTHKGNPKNYTFIVKLMKQIHYYGKQISVSMGNSANSYNSKALCITGKEAKCSISNTTSAEIVRINLQVPPVPPTDCASSNVVKVTYHLDITASTGGCSGSPKNIIPITIGTYPIEDYEVPNPNAGTAPDLVAPTTPPVDSASGNSLDKELPTYEEALDQFDSGGDDNFKPKYPVFRRPTAYSSGQ